MKSVTLSQFIITGMEVDHNTPQCVLNHMAATHGIDFTFSEDKQKHSREAKTLITALSSKYVSQYKLPIVENKTDDIQKFLNPKKYSWTLTQINTALNFYLEWMTCDRTVDPCTKLPSKWQVGLTTPDQPFNIIPTMLFKICSYHGVKMFFTTTVEQLEEYVKYLTIKNINDVSTLVNFRERLKHISVTDMVRIVSILSSSSESKTEVKTESKRNLLTFENLSKSLQKYNDLNNLRKQQKPSSNEDAVALAALNYKVDISKASNPIKEYIHLNIAQNYSPKDNQLKAIYDINKVLIDLTKSFNPLFPENYYEQKTLNNMCQAEGFTDTDISSTPCYELMQLASYEESFYYGKYPEIKNKTTTIELDDVNDIEPDNIICYGVRGEGMTAYTPSELSGLFRNSGQFKNGSNAHFSSRSIRKLKLICQNQSTKSIYNELAEAIRYVESIQNDRTGRTRQLLDYCRDNSNMTKMVDLLNQLMVVGMHMRGWLGTGKLPLTEAPVNNQTAVETKVNEAINILEVKCVDEKEVGGKLMNLPLLRYNNNTYENSNNRDQGLTIRERLDIVKQGASLYSCIRMSSNWIVASAYYYLSVLGQIPRFNIRELREIS